MLVVLCLSVETLQAQAPGVHYLHHGVMPPGAIGSQQLQRGGDLPGYYQPVEIKVPPRALVSLAVDNQFDTPRTQSRKAGFLIGAVYRLRVTNIRMAEGVEVFPSIELIDRLYPPEGQECRFSIPIDIIEDDLKLAAAGKFVTRVIYVEDPKNAVPARENMQTQAWFETSPGQDPLAVADGLGRPVAILRLGGRLPVQGEQPDPMFFYGSPPFLTLVSEAAPAKPERPETPAVKPEPAAQSKVKNLAPPSRILPVLTTTERGKKS